MAPNFQEDHHGHRQELAIYSLACRLVSSQPGRQWDNGATYPPPDDEERIGVPHAAVDVSPSQSQPHTAASHNRRSGITASMLPVLSSAHLGRQ